MTPPERTLEELAGGYDAILVDAYGVLVDGSSALPAGEAIVATLRDRGVAFYVVTNDASRLPETAARRFHGYGLPIEPEQVITSGSLLAPHFRERGLEGARCLVLGPPDSHAYVERAGGVSVAPDPAVSYDAVIPCDDAGYDFLPTVDIALSVLYRQCDAGEPPALILPNPDLVYPKRSAEFGFTSGAVALLLEAALERRYPSRGLAFERLGKPHPAIFAEAERRAGSKRLLMIGDQLETDIAGARRYGVDAALLATGITHLPDAELDPETGPSFMLTMPARSSTP